MNNNPDKIDHYAVDLYHRLGMEERSQEIARKNKPLIDWRDRADAWDEEAVKEFMQEYQKDDE